MEMINDSYEPISDHEERILDAFRESDKGVLRPTDVTEAVGETIQTNNRYLKRLVAAGWVDYPKRGLYVYNRDPREMDDEELAEMFRAYADEIDPKVTAPEQ